MMTFHTPMRHLVGAIPLYLQIAEVLTDQIKSGVLTPGQQLPPERELSEQLGVNRLTLRSALQILASQDLIVRKHGIGTFIAEPKIDRQTSKIYRFTKGVQSKGFTPGTRLVALEHVAVAATLAKELALPVSSPVFKITRLRTINAEPVLIERYTLSAVKFPNLDQHDLENQSLYEVLEKTYGVSISRARQSFEPVAASRFEAELLEVKPGAPLMLEERISYDESGQPVEHGKDVYRGDRFRFVTEDAPFDF